MENETKRIRDFKQPQRRLTRQRSGFTVSGSKTGSQCLIDFATNVIFKKQIKISFKELDVKFQNLFQNGTLIYGLGGYLKSNANLHIQANLAILDKQGNVILTNESTNTANNDIWSKFSLDITTNNNALKDSNNYDVQGFFEISDTASNVENITVEIFGLQFGAVTFYKDKPSYYTSFQQKTFLYTPEIYCLQFKPLTEFLIDSKQSYSIKDGSAIVLKSCNRCARFLPIDVSNERNYLSFSNHCKLRAPCEHNAFSRYIIESDPQKIPNNLNVIVINNKKYLQTYYGFQLECRTCKKFEVNAPLNPLRNRAQHHEDSARRRAIEQMIIELSGDDPVKGFRAKFGTEFPNYILNKFDNRCFACGIPINLQTMDIDHTLPLLYLWPLNETATALCKMCNSQKHDLFPKQFKKYDKDKLEQLSSITGIPFEIINSDKSIINPFMLNLLKREVVWFFDDFLSRKAYQKVKKGKKVSDLIFKAINKTLSREGVSLVNIYFTKKKTFPTSITLD